MPRVIVITKYALFWYNTNFLEFNSADFIDYIPCVGKSDTDLLRPPAYPLTSNFVFLSKLFEKTSYSLS